MTFLHNSSGDAMNYLLHEKGLSCKMDLIFIDANIISGDVAKYHTLANLQRPGPYELSWFLHDFTNGLPFRKQCTAPKYKNCDKGNQNKLAISRFIRQRTEFKEFTRLIPSIEGAHPYISLNQSGFGLTQSTVAGLVHSEAIMGLLKIYDDIIKKYS